MRWTLMISRLLCQFWQNTPIADQEQNAEPGAASGRIRGGKLSARFPETLLHHFMAPRENVLIRSICRLIPCTSAPVPNAWLPTTG
jgi:hypothetical protein